MNKLFIIAALLCVMALAESEAKPEASPQFLGAADPYKYQPGYGTFNAYKPYNYDATKYGADPYNKWTGYQHQYSAYPYNHGIHGYSFQRDTYGRAGFPYTAGMLNSAYPYSGIHNPGHLYNKY